MKLNKPNRQNPEIKPLPNVPVPPTTAPEITPKPDKNTPYRPTPEIVPKPIPEVDPLKENK